MVIIVRENNYGSLLSLVAFMGTTLRFVAFYGSLYGNKCVHCTYCLVLSLLSKLSLSPLPSFYLAFVTLILSMSSFYLAFVTSFLLTVPTPPALLFGGCRLSITSFYLSYLINFKFKVMFIKI